MLPRFVGFLALATFASLLAPSPAHAEEPAQRPPPRTDSGLHPHPVLLTVGSALGAVGYGAVAVPALPSAGGLTGRLLYFLGTGGLGWIASCWMKSTSYEDPPGSYPKTRMPDNYVCSGTHGSVLLLVPIAGPLLFLDEHPSDSVLNPNGRELGDLSRGLLWASTAAQASGVLLLLASLIVGAPSRPSDGERPPAVALPRSRPRIAVLPAFGPGSAGLTLRIEERP